MREIKFMAFHKPSGKMYYVAGIDHVVEPPDYYDEPEMKLTEEIQHVFLVEKLPGWAKIGWTDAKDVELLQYTERKDKHGKEVYDGYILKSEMWPGGTLGPFYNLYTISWGDYFVTVPGSDYEETEEQKYTGWRYTGISSLPQHNKNKETYYGGLAEMQDDVEIVGTIYDTPELLQQTT